MLRTEKGITLVALVITIIVLVILAAVSIAAVTQSRIVNYAINGTQNYVTKAEEENTIINGTVSIMDSAVSAIESITANQ